MTPPPTPLTPPRRLPRMFPWALLVLAGVVVLDQVSKWLVVEFLEPRTAYPVIGDLARIYVTRNSGAAFSMGESATPVFAVIQLLATVLCIILAFRARNWWTVAAVGLIGGGAAGNFIDRVFRAPGALHGHVVDFISVGDFAIFNVADSGITVGVAVYLIYGLLIEPRDHRRVQRQGGGGAGAEPGTWSVAGSGAELVAEPVADPAVDSGPHSVETSGKEEV